MLEIVLPLRNEDWEKRCMRRGVAVGSQLDPICERIYAAFAVSIVRMEFHDRDREASELVFDA